MKNFSQFWEGYVASADKKVGKDGKLRPAKHIKTQSKDEDEKEVVEKLDLKKADMGDVIKDFQDSDAPQFKGKSDKKKREMAIAAKLSADGKSKNEEVDQLDELSKQTLGSYVKKASNDSAAKAYSSASAAKDNNPEKGGKDFVKSRQRQKGIEKATDRLTKEELKGNQHKLDKNKNGKLDADDFKKIRKEDMTPEQKRKRLEMIRKSAQKLNRKAEMDAKRAMRSDPVLGRRPVDEATPNKKQVKQAIGIARDKRYAGGNMTGATKVMDKINKGLAQHPAVSKELKKQNESVISENAEMEKKEMMKTQLHFIKYACDEICEYIDMGGNIEEWYQNKVSKSFADFEGLHSYMEGTARKDGLKEETIDENAAVKKKASKSGMSYSTLMKVYRRGVAAWNSGHRPGTTPEQWGLARVNSYTTKGKGTYHGADKDLRKEDVAQIDELHRDTISSYSKKAVANAADASNKGDVKTVDKRIGGIKRASQQLDKKKLGEDTHVVMYHDKDGKHVNNSKPMTADKAKAHAEKGNKIDKVGGKYIVKKMNEADNPPFTPDPPKKNAKPQRNSDGSITSPMSKAKQLAKQAVKNAEKTVAQHKEGVQFDSDGNILEAKNKITFHQFMGATKKKDDKTKNKESESTDPTRL